MKLWATIVKRVEEKLFRNLNKWKKLASQLREPDNIMTPEERIKIAEEIGRAFETNDLDSLFNEQLKSLYDPNVSIVERISPRKSAVFYMIANAHTQSTLTFNSPLHMYIAAMLFGFQLGHDYVAKYGPIPNEEIIKETIEKLLDFKEEE